MLELLTIIITISIRKFNLSLVSLAVAVALMGCGGVSDNKDDSSDNHALSGHVIDPAIVGATVKMACGSDTYDAVGLTDSTGAFSITSIPKETLNNRQLFFTG